MRLDNYLLPIDEGKEKACEKTALLYILYKLNEEILCEQVNRHNPIRNKQEDESYEEYDDYLSGRLQAYEQYLGKHGKGHLLNNSENFHSKMMSLQVWEGLNFIKHPDLHNQKIDVQSEFYMQTACQLYGFKDYLSSFSNPFRLQLCNIEFGRKSKLYRYAADLLLLLKVLIYIPVSKVADNPAVDEKFLLSFILAKKMNDTWMNKLARMAYFSLTTPLLHMNYKYSKDNFWFDLWLPVIKKLSQ